MESEEQIRLLDLSIEGWNSWRRSNREIRPNLSPADIIGKDLRGVDLSNTDLAESNFTRSNLGEANLSGANLTWADLTDTDLSDANLNGANLRNATLYRANLNGATLIQADLTEANLMEAHLSADLSGGTLLIRAKLTEADLVGADLSDAILTDADLSGTRLIHTNLARANLSGSFVYGASVWDVDLSDAAQRDLVIAKEPRLTVDNLEVAQLINLILDRSTLRNVLDTMTSKTVLLLGRFTPERKVILDAMADELREYNLLPIIFDFDRATDRDFTETIKVLAGLSLFVIADITWPRSVPQELTATIPDYEIPFVPILQSGKENRVYSMFANLTKYDWVLKPVLEYTTKEDLLAYLKDVVDRACDKHLELRLKKSRPLEVRPIGEAFRHHT